MTEEQRKQCEEIIINSWNGEIDANFHDTLMSIAAVFGKDKDITEENYEEIIDGILLELLELGEEEIYQSNQELEEELYQSNQEREERWNMLDNEVIEAQWDFYDMVLKDLEKTKERYSAFMKSFSVKRFIILYFVEKEKKLEDFKKQNDKDNNENIEEKNN